MKTAAPQAACGRSFFCPGTKNETVSFLPRDPKTQPLRFCRRPDSRLPPLTPSLFCRRHISPLTFSKNETVSFLKKRAHARHAADPPEQSSGVSCRHRKQRSLHPADEGSATQKMTASAQAYLNTFQKRNRFVFESARRNPRTGQGAPARPRRVPAAASRSARAGAPRLSAAPAGHAPSPKNEMISFLPRDPKTQPLRFCRRPDSRLPPPASHPFTFLPRNQKRNHFVFAAVTSHLSPFPKTKPFRFCRRPAA